MKNFIQFLSTLGIGITLALVFAFFAYLINITSGDMALALIATKIAMDLS